MSGRGWLGGALALFYDRSVFVRSALHGSGAGVVRLVVLCSLVGGAAAAQGGWVLWRDLGSADLSAVPQLRLEDGELSSPVAQPYRFETEAGEVIVDTTGALTDADRQGAVIVLEREQYTMTPPGKDPVTRPYSLPDMEVDASTARSQLLRVLGMGVAGMAGGRALLVAVLALFGAALVQHLGGASYRDALRLTALALTPAALLDALQHLVGWTLPAYNLVALGVWVAYGEWAVRSLQEVRALSIRRRDPGAA